MEYKTILTTCPYCGCGCGLYLESWMAAWSTPSRPKPPRLIREIYASRDGMCMNSFTVKTVSLIRWCAERNA